MSRLNPGAPDSLSAAVHAATRAAIEAVMRSPVPERAVSTPAGAPPPAPQGATPRNTAQQFRPQSDKTKPRPPRALNPNQLTAARLPLAGQTVGAVAAALSVHPYTVSRWKADPRFQAELRRQVASATARHTAQQGATFSRPL